MLNCAITTAMLPTTRSGRLISTTWWQMTAGSQGQEARQSRSAGLRGRWIGKHCCWARCPPVDIHPPPSTLLFVRRLKRAGLRAGIGLRMSVTRGTQAAVDRILSQRGGSSQQPLPPLQTSGNSGGPEVVLGLGNGGANVETNFALRKMLLQPEAVATSRAASADREPEADDLSILDPEEEDPKYDPCVEDWAVKYLNRIDVSDESKPARCGWLLQANCHQSCSPFRPSNSLPPHSPSQVQLALHANQSRDRVPWPWVNCNHDDPLRCTHAPFLKSFSFLSCHPRPP